MKEEYDFTNAERGKFYHPDAAFNIPVYLDSDVKKFVEKIARKKKKDIAFVVNDILKQDMKLAGSIR